jgi:hypothetical protein
MTEITSSTFTVVETMPEHLRESHRSARNFGVWPHNGAERVLMTHDAAAMVDEDADGYTRIVRAATVEDFAAHLGMNPDDECTPEGIDWGYAAGPAEGAPVFLRDGWTADDGNAEVAYPHATSGREAAEEYTALGDWGDVVETMWVRVNAWQACVSVDACGDVIHGTYARDSYTIPIEPEEPGCANGCEHDWHADQRVVGGIAENPGVWGHGGGVIIREHCRHCGVYRVTDTWAQDRESGVQGLLSVGYKEADDASLGYIRDVALD